MKTIIAFALLLSSCTVAKYSMQEVVITVKNGKPIFTPISKAVPLSDTVNGKIGYLIKRIK